MKLLKWQKNKIFDKIVDSGMTPAAFEIQEISNTASEDGVITEIKFKGTSYHFRLTSGDDEYVYCICSPGVHNVNQVFPYSKRSEVIHNLDYWLEALSAEIEEDDKWERMENELKQVNIQVYTEVDRFSFHEYKILTEKIDEIKEGLSRLQLLPQQLQLMNDKLDYLVIKAEDMSKFDWQALFVGTLVSIIIQLKVTPDNASAVWQLIKSVFQNYLIH